VTITRPFQIGMTEVTLAAWRAVGFSDPVFPPGDPFRTCEQPGCPVLTTSWFDALAYANALSERSGLEPCYALRRCRGEPGGTSRTPGGPPGSALDCEEVALRAPTVYDCRGYRLPTGAEWEYAARAGTATAYYSGGQSPNRIPGTCYPEHALLPVAWFCANSPRRRPHPVGLLRSNAWGLHDVLGNAMEWTSENHDGRSLPGPSVDPYGALSTTADSNVRGEGFTSWPDILRIAAVSEGGHHDRGTGFRLARSLPP
jgi:formylglycine-generating enzyme required for sulfatase activity